MYVLLALGALALTVVLTGEWHVTSDPLEAPAAKEMSSQNPSKQLGTRVSSAHMDPPRITQQTSTTLPLRATLRIRATRRGRGRSAPGTFRGPLQWLLEGSGWNVLRPTVDFVLLCVAVVLALGGVAGGRCTPLRCARRCWRCRRW